MPARRFVNVLVRGMPRTPILCRIGTPRSAAVRVSTAESDLTRRLLENTHAGPVRFALEDGDVALGGWKALRAPRFLRW
jgi:hypothetical protein